MYKSNQSLYFVETTLTAIRAVSSPLPPLRLDQSQLLTTILSVMITENFFDLLGSFCVLTCSELWAKSFATSGLDTFQA